MVVETLLQILPPPRPDQIVALSPPCSLSWPGWRPHPTWGPGVGGAPGWENVPPLFLVLCFLEKYHFVFSVQGFRYFARILKHGNKWLVGSGSLGPPPRPSLDPSPPGPKEVGPAGAPQLPGPFLPPSCWAGPKLEALGADQVRAIGGAQDLDGPSPTPPSLLGFLFHVQ